jgi:hypothetical protein
MPVGAAPVIVSFLSRYPSGEGSITARKTWLLWPRRMLVHLLTPLLFALAINMYETDFMNMHAQIRVTQVPARSRMAYDLVILQ